MNGLEVDAPLQHAEQFLAFTQQDLRSALGEEAYHSLVSERAYMLWRNGYSKDSDTNWFEAERRLREELH